MKWAFKHAPTTNPTDQAVLLAIADHIGEETGVGYPSVERIARYARCSVRTAHRAIKRLQSLKVLTVESGRSGRTSNHYRIPITCHGDMTTRQVRPDTVSRKRRFDLSQSQTIPNSEPLLNPSSRARALANFEQFWRVYPRKEKRKEAWQEFQKLNPDEPLVATIIAAVERKKGSEEWRRENGRYIPHARKWLHLERWTDEEEQRAATPMRPFESEEEHLAIKHGVELLKKHRDTGTVTTTIELFEQTCSDHQLHIPPHDVSRLWDTVRRQATAPAIVTSPTEDIRGNSPQVQTSSAISATTQEQQDEHR
jgi:hypothetical protein